jgi:spore germination cell wall hydrolase CwlJ-like protein
VKRRYDWRGALLFLAIVTTIAFILYGILMTTLPAIGSELRDREMLARMAYSEARGDGVLGMTAVSNVAINRLSDGRFGMTLVEVLRAPSQFAVGPARRASDRHWQLALWVAEGALDGTLPDLTHGSTFFHKCNMKRKPAWTQGLTFSVRVRSHCFYSRRPS